MARPSRLPVARLLQDSGLSRLCLALPILEGPICLHCLLQRRSNLGPHLPTVLNPSVGTCKPLASLRIPLSPAHRRPSGVCLGVRGGPYLIPLLTVGHAIAVPSDDRLEASRLGNAPCAGRLAVVQEVIVCHCPIRLAIVHLCSGVSAFYEEHVQRRGVEAVQRDATKHHWSPGGRRRLTAGGLSLLGLLVGPVFKKGLHVCELRVGGPPCCCNTGNACRLLLLSLLVRAAGQKRGHLRKLQLRVSRSGGSAVLVGPVGQQRLHPHQLRLRGPRGRRRRRGRVERAAAVPRAPRRGQGLCEEGCLVRGRGRHLHLSGSKFRPRL
mmetsp:Transcript_105129/g.307245  ORF Transcript_105129/g.307245 Transcript_105129/m.307245 type:complete len:324 (+) Transcript_105129:121-1092(+)